MMIISVPMFRQQAAAGAFLLILPLVSAIISPSAYAESGSTQVMISLVVPATAENSLPTVASQAQNAAAQYQSSTMTLQNIPLTHGHQPVWIAI